MYLYNIVNNGVVYMSSDGVEVFNPERRYDTRGENYKNVPKRVPIPQKIPKTKKTIKTNRIERRIQKYRFHVKLYYFVK